MAQQAFSLRKTYSEKLRDPRWQKRRLEVLSRDNFQCLFCDSKVCELQVHHKVYRKGAEPWDYDLDDLVTACAECHAYIGRLRDDLFGQIQDMDVYYALMNLHMMLRYNPEKLVEARMFLFRLWHPVETQETTVP